MLKTVIQDERLIKAIEEAAGVMEANSLDEKELTIPGTEIKLYLVKDGTDKSASLNAVKGSFFGISHEFQGKKFLVFRTNKTVQS